MLVIIEKGKIMKDNKNMKKIWNRLVACTIIFVSTVIILTGCSVKETVNTNTDKNENKTTETESVSSTASEASDTKDTDVTSVETGDPIRIVKTFEGTCQVQTQLAYLLGFYEAEGLVEGVDYEFVDSGSETGAVLISTDKADLVIGLIAGMLQPLDNGLEAKAILGLHTGCITLVTLGDSEVKSTADLKGKTIGVTQLSSSNHIAALRALNFEGLTADDVEFVVYDSDTIQQALLNGAVDVIALSDYKAKILERDEGARIIFDTSTDPRLKDENCCVLFARNGVIDEYPQRLAKICTAIQKASVWIANNPELAAEIQVAQGYALGEAEVNKKLLLTYQFPTSLTSLKEAVYRNFDDAKVLGLLKENTDEAVLAESSYLFLDGVADGLDITTIEAPKDPNQFLIVKEE
jgi:NitT/TauT family transport system substrate-binding protein